MTPRVALIGANGHGLSHRRAIASRHEAGVLELVALCDLAPVRDEPGAPVPRTTRVCRDHRELFASTALDVAVICTPPHTHLEIATAAARAGADLLLEKPPVMALAEHDALHEVLAATGRVCQVGFQALGSAALAELTAAVSTGALGTVTAVSAVGAWQRPDAYYRRAPWAGRRSVDGRPVLDGALANPFAHALMQCLAVCEAVAGAPARPGPVALQVELERYRARQIDVDDTTVLRVRAEHRPPVLVAVTLCGDEFIPGEVLVYGEGGRAVLEYPTDTLRLPGDAAPRRVPGRINLLDNLLAHRADGHPLLAPLGRTASFTALVETVLAAPDPHPIGAPYRDADGGVITVPGLSALLRRAASEQVMLADIGVPWAAPAWRTTTGTTT